MIIENTMARLSYIVTIIGITLMCIMAEELYTDQFDNFDVPSILQNDALRDQYVDCILEKSPCQTEHQKFVKEIFGEAVLTNCKKCTKQQKINTILVVDWFTKNKPEQWETIVAKMKEDIKNGGQ